MNDFYEPDGPPTVRAKPATIPELFDRITEQATEDARRMALRDKDFYEDRQLTKATLIKLDKRITRVERMAFPQPPLWALVAVGLVIAAVIWTTKTGASDRAPAPATHSAR